MKAKAFASTTLAVASCCSPASTAAGASALGSTGSVETAPAQMREAPQAASAGLPNILVIFGDDIGQTNISAYSFGLMGFETPNIDFGVCPIMKDARPAVQLFSA